MWQFLMIFLMAAALASAVYLTGRFYKFAWTGRLAGGRRWLQLLLAAVPVVLILGGAWLTMGSFNAVVVLLHLVVIWALSDLVSFIVTKTRKAPLRRYYAGAAALAVTAAYLCVGWVLAHNVWSTHYALTTNKSVGNLRVALVADAHVGTTFDGAGFGKWMEKLGAEQPDVVAVVGDFVDDDTSLADMVSACQALGRLDEQVPYGVYYVFGNHDKGYYGPAYRGYGGDELLAQLEQNGVTVLQDESVLLGDRFYLIGRKDRSEEYRGGGRLSMEELTALLDREKYWIVLDHQPQDFDAQADAGVDLVLSGHTHGGWLFPVNYINARLAADDLVYGRETRGDTNFIVTSGISDWAMQFRTGCKSEYVIIDITQQ